MPKIRGGFKIVNLILATTVVAVTAWLLLNRQFVLDWWRLQTYNPPAEIVALANNTTMAGRGRDLFFASKPTLAGRESFNEFCTDTGEESIVLGCYRAHEIYLFDVTDDRLRGVEEVTAAHEMLHAVYERLNEGERRTLDGLLDTQIKRITNQRLLDLIKLYNQHEPGQLYNEMHSIIGTEVRDISPDLEKHYQQYFADRKKVVGYSENYEAVFNASKQRIGQYDVQLAQLTQQIDANNQTLQAQQIELAAESQQLSQLGAQGDIDAYNSAVPTYNSKVRAFNALVEQTKQLIAQHNAIVEQRNKEAAAQNELYQSLDSQYQAVPTN